MSLASDSNESKAALLKRLPRLINISIAELMGQKNILEVTLYNWLKHAKDGEPPVPGDNKMTDEWPAEAKFVVVLEQLTFLRLNAVSITTVRSSKSGNCSRSCGAEIKPWPRQQALLILQKMRVAKAAAGGARYWMRAPASGQLSPAKSKLEQRGGLKRVYATTILRIAAHRETLSDDHSLGMDDDSYVSGRLESGKQVHDI